MLSQRTCIYVFVGPTLDQHGVYEKNVRLMLAHRIHEYITTLAQHCPNMLDQRRATLQLDLAPTLGQQTIDVTLNHCRPNVGMLSGYL